jgi:hypothetical protein
MAVLQANKLRATVNLTGIDAVHGLPLNVDVSTPLGVTLDTIDPPKVSVTLSAPTE